MGWTGIALALTEPGGDEMASRLATYLHPVAGRPLVWHTLSALATLRSPPDRLVLLTRPDLSVDLFTDLPLECEVVKIGDGSFAETVESLNIKGRLLLVDAAAPLLSSTPDEMLARSDACWLADASGLVSALAFDAENLARLSDQADPLAAVAELFPDGRVTSGEESMVVQSRAELSMVGAILRDRIVKKLMAAGATFLLPETVLVDVDVRVGRDAVIYPGVVLEGQTNIGEETVVGPGCRVIDSWIGSGVELKGWNFIAHTSIRNRAILEPYVRRGYD